jgi:hypothetical protein
MNYPVPEKYEFPANGPDYISVPQYRHETEQEIKPGNFCAICFKAKIEFSIIDRLAQKPTDYILSCAECRDTARFTLLNSIEAEATQKYFRTSQVMHDDMRSMRDEMQADQRAMDIYLRMGHSRNEAFHAFQSVFNNHHVHIDHQSKIVFDFVKSESRTFRFHTRERTKWEKFKLWLLNLKVKLKK